MAIPLSLIKAETNRPSISDAHKVTSITGPSNFDDWPVLSSSTVPSASPKRLRGGGRRSSSQSTVWTKTILRQQVLNCFHLSARPASASQPTRRPRVAIQQTPNPDDSTWHGDPPLLLSDPSVVQVLFKKLDWEDGLGSDSRDWDFQT